MKVEAVLITIAILLFTQAVLSLPYLDQDDVGEEYDNLENFQKKSYRDPLLGNRPDDIQIKLLRFGRRSCVRRGDRCDHRPNDCCNNSACRCNLWGNNCMCERLGLFQQWGK
ncbi:hypothetical protein CHUAL_000397 [Chamberlinius hualienensis]